MRTTKPAYTLALASAFVLCGCASASDASMTEETIQERVAAAQREARTFTFEWTEPEGGTGSGVVTRGQIEYDDAGDVSALSLDIGDGDTEYRFVDDTLYKRSDGDEFSQAPDDEKEQVLQGWDWAAAAENDSKPQEIEDKGEDEVGGVTATEYELVFGDDTATWWVDDDDELVKFADEAGNECALGDYGEPVDIPAP